MTMTQGKVEQWGEARDNENVPEKKSFLLRGSSIFPTENEF